MQQQFRAWSSLSGGVLCPNVISLLSFVGLTCQPPAFLVVYCNPGNFRKRLVFVLFVNSWNLLKFIAYYRLKCTVKRSNL